MRGEEDERRSGGQERRALHNGSGLACRACARAFHDSDRQ